MPKSPALCDIAGVMKTTWRFFLGAAIGAGLGYALVLLTHPGPKRKAERWATLYRATSGKSEEHSAT